MLSDMAKGVNAYNGLREVALKPFYPYKSIGHYNGIVLKPRLLQTLILQVVGSMEEYMQISFQLHPDESEAADCQDDIGFHKGR